MTRIALTKLDGTAKGGIAVAVARELSIPIVRIGVGEGIDDLRPFVAAEFASRAGLGVSDDLYIGPTTLAPGPPEQTRLLTTSHG